MSKNTSNRYNIPMIIAAILLCLTLFSTHMTSGLYARYTSSATGTDSARVAIFQITGTNDWEGGSTIDLALSFYDAAQSSDTLNFTVSSASEVSVRYSVTIEMPQTYSNGVAIDYSWLTVKIDEGTPVTASSNVITFENVGSFEPTDGSSKTHTLVFSIDESFMGLPILTEDITGKVNFTIRAEQVD